MNEAGLLNSRNAADLEDERVLAHPARRLTVWNGAFALAAGLSVALGASISGGLDRLGVIRSSLLIGAGLAVAWILTKVSLRQAWILGVTAGIIFVLVEIWQGLDAQAGIPLALAIVVYLVFRGLRPADLRMQIDLKGLSRLGGKAVLFPLRQLTQRLLRERRS
jgi:hypothetical protein